MLITGGASGIGYALGLRLVRAGARVALADIDHQAVLDRAEELNRAVGKQVAVGHHLDVRDEVAFRRVVDAVWEDGPLDLLFNNAGIVMGGPTEELTSAHWDRIIDVNVKGVVNGVLAAYPLMIRRGGGHIVNTASGAGLVAAPFIAAYAATKHAVVGLSTALRPEAARHGVSVSVLCPGSVDTPILDRLPDADLPERKSPAATGRDYARVLGFTPGDADAFARRALRAVAKDRGIIVEPPSTRALWYLWRLSPALVERITRRLADKIGKELLDAPTESR